MPTKEESKKGFVERIKHPLFLAAFFSVVYQLGSEFLGWNIASDDFRLWVDLLMWAVIGSGVYSKFKKTEMPQ